MTTNHDGQLDTEIKELLGRAVAETPQPPNLEHPMLMKSNISDPRKRNPWIIGGSIGLTAAAALLAFAIIPGIGDQTTIQTPATDPAVVDETVAPDPNVTVADVEVTPTTIAEIAEVEPIPADPVTVEPDPGAVEPPLAGPDPVTPAEPTPALASPAVLNAGVNGVTLTTGVDGQEPSTETLSEQPAIVAVRSSDGRVWIDSSIEVGVATITVVDPQTSATTQIELPLADGHFAQLHDVATVQGELTLLYTTFYRDCTGLLDDACTMTIRTFEPDTGTSATLADGGAWESGWGQLQLANNGLVVGTEFSSANHAPVFLNISNGVTPTAEALGIEGSYSDCGDCPTSFTIDQQGEHVAWLEGSNDNRQIVIVKLATGIRTTVFMAPAPVGSNAGALQIADFATVDGEVTSGQALLSPSASPWGQFEGTPFLTGLSTGDVTTLAATTIATIS